MIWLKVELGQSIRSIGSSDKCERSADERNDQIHEETRNSDKGEQTTRRVKEDVWWCAEGERSLACAGAMSTIARSRRCRNSRSRMRMKEEKHTFL
jgi:hypothetical protein